MRIVLADVKGSGGYVSKDTVVGGYGARLRPFSNTAGILIHFKRRYISSPSVQMAYLAAICARAGHDVLWSRGDLVDGDVAIVLSSLVDYRQETAWADTMRARGVRVGCVGLAASMMPELFVEHCDFVIRGEPEDAVGRLAHGEVLEGLCDSPPINDLDSLPFPRWDLTRDDRYWLPFRVSARPPGGGFPLLASRSCPESCTYCPHRILAGYRVRSVGNIVDEIEQLANRFRRPYIVFRDPLFTEDRDRCLALCDEIEARDLRIRFECETRFDRLDTALLQRLHRAGLRAIGFGVESVSANTLRKVGRRLVPEAHQRAIIQECRQLGVTTVGFFILGFLTDDWESVAATIHYATDLGPTLAQFKLLTPYPGTPLWRQMAPLVTEYNWERFDGYTPTFRHPNLTERELKFLLASAYARFYFRPSYLSNMMNVRNTLVRNWVGRLDARASARHSRNEIAIMCRAVTC